MGTDRLFLGFAKARKGPALARPAYRIDSSSAYASTVFDADGPDHAHCVHGPFRRRKCRSPLNPAAFPIVKRWIDWRPVVPPATVPKVFTCAGLENAMQLHRLLWMDRLVGSMGDLAPYAALGFALPGGSLIALALWAARHHPMTTLTWRRVRALMIVVVAVFATAQPAFANSGIVPGDLSRAELLSPVTLKGAWGRAAQGVAASEAGDLQWGSVQQSRLNGPRPVCATECSRSVPSENR